MIMKSSRKIKIGLVVLMLALLLGGASLETEITTYKTLVVSAAGAETDLVAATGFTVGIPSPGTLALQPKDLLKLFGKGSTLIANSIELICYATASENNTAEMSLYGISGEGPPEKIAGLVYIFGTAIRSSSVRWADSCAVTGTHLKTVSATDSTNNRVVKVLFDATGYKFLYMIVHGTATGAATNITVQMRGF